MSEEEKRLRVERDEAAQEAAEMIEFLKTHLGWEWFWSEGWVGEEFKSQAKQNAQRLRRFLDEKGHAKAFSLRLDTALAQVAKLREEIAARFNLSSPEGTLVYSDLLRAREHLEKCIEERRHLMYEARVSQTLRDTALADVARLRARGNELWDVLDRLRQFRHAEACDRRDACACWELELHVLMPVLRNEPIATDPAGRKT